MNSLGFNSRIARDLTADALAMAGAPATASVRGLVYRRTWPTAQSLDWMEELGLDPRGACDGWLDSSLDLRDGLSVVEVFAAPIVADEAFGELVAH